MSMKHPCIKIIVQLYATCPPSESNYCFKINFRLSAQSANGVTITKRVCCEGFENESESIRGWRFTIRGPYKQWVNVRLLLRQHEWARDRSVHLSCITYTYRPFALESTCRDTLTSIVSGNIYKYSRRRGAICPGHLASPWGLPDCNPITGRTFSLYLKRALSLHGAIRPVCSTRFVALFVKKNSTIDALFLFDRDTPAK